MKKIMTLMLGLSLVFGATSFAADEKPAADAKKEKKASKKKAEKKEEAPKH
jgi:hypothetical protein